MCECVCVCARECVCERERVCVCVTTVIKKYPMNLKDRKHEMYMGRLEEEKGEEKLCNYNLKT